ncbi:four-helix bundle copper-binding protein [Candidatus Methanoperedens nitratireducens]|nr:four-helix bundle copper-binding protein [Candidatus Methanoperedens nitroreducens]
MIAVDGEAEPVISHITFAHDKKMETCADVCRRCAESCRQMAGMSM